MTVVLTHLLKLLIFFPLIPGKCVTGSIIGLFTLWERLTYTRPRKPCPTLPMNRDGIEMLPKVVVRCDWRLATPSAAAGNSVVGWAGAGGSPSGTTSSGDGGAPQPVKSTSGPSDRYTAFIDT